MRDSEELMYQEVVRDVVFLYHESWNYRSVVVDITPILGYGGPYYAWFDNEDPLVAVGTSLMFLGMLRDWMDHSGCVFTSIAQPFGKYLDALLTVYEQAQQHDDTTMIDLYQAILATCALLDRRGEIDKHLPDLMLAPELLARFRNVVQAGGLEHTEEEIWAAMPRLYEAHIWPYFCECCK